MRWTAMMADTPFCRSGTDEPEGVEPPHRRRTPRATSRPRSSAFELLRSLDVVSHHVGFRIELLHREAPVEPAPPEAPPAEAVAEDAPPAEESPPAEEPPPEPKKKKKKA